ncbi:Pelota-like protein [Spironucleus salmonicida]|uniref:Pelota-like protein n=1 Tax=Spironucleus salmonicida TaxID=348837 RepID=V6LRS1_9EUKA|nr:Pelota-like protein [Spironucleus salmonicida]|eukprot:EST47357.1 Pelota-like protein [Spironucleus salmonicida]
MIITKNKVDSSYQGYIEMVPQSVNDLQLISTLLNIGNKVGSVTSRKILMGQKMDRKTVKIVIKVQKLQFSRTDSEIIVSGNVVLTSNPDIPINSSHTIKILLNMKFTLSKNWSQEDIDLLTQPTDLIQQCIVALSPGIARIHLYGEILEYVARVEIIMPCKNRFNGDKVQKYLHKFMDEVVQTVQNKVKVKNLIFCGYVDLVKQIQKYNIDNYDIVYQPTKNFRIRSCVNELIQLDILKSSIWQSSMDILDEFTLRLTKGGYVVYSQDVIQTIIQYPSALENVLVMQSVIEQDYSYLKILSGIQDVLIKVPDYADPAEKLRSFGGMIGLLKYEIFLENRKVEGQIFNDFDQFSESEDI